MKRKPLFILIAAIVAPQAYAEETLSISPVVVTATRVEQNSFDLPVSIDVVNGDTIRDSRQQINLSEVAARIPGVVVANRFNLAQDLSVSTRGFGARSAFGVRGVRLYEDGIPLSMPDGQGQTGTFNLDTARQIEFMRGPFSALYGNSSGGVVQILTKNGAKDPTVSGGLTLGSYNTRRESLTVEGEVSNVNYVVNGSHLSTDGYRDHSEATRDMLHAKLSYNASDATKITLIATSLNQNDTKDPLALNASLYASNPKQAGTGAVSADTRANKQQTHTGLVIDHKISEQESVSVMGYYGTRTSDGYLVTNKLSAIDRQFGGFDTKWTFKDNVAGKPFSLVAGLSYDKMQDDRTQFNTTNGVVSSALKRNEVQTVHNFDQYIQATIEPTDRLLLVGGLRHTKINFNVDDKMPVIPGTDPDGSGSLGYSNTSPVLGATFKVTPSLNLYANYGEGFETPTFIEMTYTGDPAIGAGPNLTIQPSTSKNYEVGAKAFVGDNTRVNLALFKVDTKKEIVVDQGIGTTASYKNAGDTERHGLELSIDSVLPYNFGVYAAYTLMNAEFKDRFCTGTSCTPSTQVNSGNKIPGAYTSNTYAEVSWKHPSSGFSSALEGIYFSDVFTNDINTIQAKSYATFNLRGGFVQNLGNWKLNEFVRVDNLTDKTYVSSVRINTSSAYDPGAPRNWTMGLNASYKF